MAGPAWAVAQGGLDLAGAGFGPPVSHRASSQCSGASDGLRSGAGVSVSSVSGSGAGLTLGGTVRARGIFACFNNRAASLRAQLSPTASERERADALQAHGDADEAQRLTLTKAADSATGEVIRHKDKTAADLTLGTVAYEGEPTERAGEGLIWLDAAMADRLRAMRRLTDTTATSFYGWRPGRRGDERRRSGLLWRLGADAIRPPPADLKNARHEDQCIRS